MKIGKQEHRSSALSTSSADTIVIRGKDLCQELIGHVGFTDYVWFLLTGEIPKPAQRRVLDATLVAIAEHGLVPSVQASRMTYAAAPEALQGAVAAGILGCGSVILGAAQDAGVLLSEVVERSKSLGPDAAAAQAIEAPLVTGLPDFTQLVEKVGPAVVNIEATGSQSRNPMVRGWIGTT